MKIRQLFDPATSSYSYLLWDGEQHEAVLIDPVLEQAERDLKLIEELGLNLRYTLETHVHADHISGGGVIREQLHSRYAVHANSRIECADWLLEEGDTISFGGYSLQALYTPGHTNTDICYSTDGYLFSGDTLLIRGSGRTDFQSGDSGAAWDSIQQQLFSLPDETVVYPGHDYNGFTRSTIAEEKAHNPRLHSGQTREGYMEIMDNMKIAKPQRIEVAVPGNMRCGL